MDFVGSGVGAVAVVPFVDIWGFTLCGWNSFSWRSGVQFGIADEWQFA
jgi:hypothetical protein